MKNICLAITILTLFLTTLPNQAIGQPKSMVIDDFTHGLSPKWQRKSFQGETLYTLTNDGPFTALKAVSNNSASGLFYKIEYKPSQYPTISWSWKIDHTLAKGDARTKEGDDYAARVYVVFPGFFFWQTKALNYIWANRLPKGKFIANSHTANAVMIAVESGPQKAGVWLHEQRDIVKDYQKAFGKMPPKVGSIAIMTDTDNTASQAKAWYGPIFIGR